MIDTICILVPLRMASLVFGHDPRQTKRIIKPSKSLITQGIYFPKVTIYKPRFGCPAVIKIEFSAPKIVFGNNLQELNENHYQEVLITLQNRLQLMGVILSKQSLSDGYVSIVHYSKNIILQDGYRSEYILNQFSRLNISKRLDVTKVQYRNNGQSFYVYTGSHHLIVYDKVADLNTSKCRAVDRDQTKDQKELFKQINSEILRFEVRLCSKRKINSFFQEMGRIRDPTLLGVFNSTLSRKIILHYWNKVLGVQNSNVFTIRATENDILREIIRVMPNVKTKKALYLAQLVSASKRDGGMRELRKILSPIVSNRNWYGYNDELMEITSKLNNVTCDWVNQIDRSLSKFESIK